MLKEPTKLMVVSQQDEESEPLHWSTPSETELELDSDEEEYKPSGRNAQRHLKSTYKYSQKYPCPTQKYVHKCTLKVSLPNSKVRTVLKKYPCPTQKYVQVLKVSLPNSKYVINTLSRNYFAPLEQYLFRSTSMRIPGEKGVNV